MKEPRDHARALLRKAANDLTAAQAILSTGEALDTVCFHAQQVVEKSLKAILALHEVVYPWRHDLGELVEFVRPLAPEIVSFEDRIFGLTPYAVEVRYDVEFEPALPEAEEALEIALEVYHLGQKVVDRQGGGIQNHLT